MASSKPEDRRGRRGDGAVEELAADHREVMQLFAQYERMVESAAADDDKELLALQICGLLEAHTAAEEDVFYPAARGALDDDAVLKEAIVEHATAKGLILQIRRSSPGDPLYDAAVKVLGEYVGHHVREEESELFPKVRKAPIDLEALGERVRARRHEALTASSDEAA